MTVSGDTNTGGTTTAASPGQQAYLQWTNATGSVLQFRVESIRSEDWDEGATVTEHPVEVGANVADHVRVELPKVTLSFRSSNEPITMAGNPTQDLSVNVSLLLTVPAVLQQPTPGAVTYPEWKNMILERVMTEAAGGNLGQALGGSTGNVLGAASGAILGSLLFAGETVTKTAAVNAGQSQVILATQVAATVQQWPNGTDYVEQTHALLVQLKNSAQVIDVYGSKQTEFSMVIETLTFHRDADTGTGEDVTIGLKQVRIVSTQTVALPVPNLSAGGGLPTVPKGQQSPQPLGSAYLSQPQLQAMSLPDQLNYVGLVVPGINSAPLGNSDE
jgi:hypothetical protein